MKATTLLLAAALPFAAATWMDGGGRTVHWGSRPDPQHALEVMGTCKETGGDPEVCACTAQHVMVGTPIPAAPGVAAGPAGPDPVAGYRASCERWARVLGLAGEGRTRGPLAGR